jgi:hypothetical protein
LRGVVKRDFERVTVLRAWFLIVRPIP